MALAAAAKARLAEAQHRNALLLLANTGIVAAAGLLFWLLLTRVLGVGADDVGMGYSVVALGTLAAVLGKGGLDTALMRLTPGASRRSATRLLVAATLAAATLAALLVLCASLAAGAGGSSALGLGGGLADLPSSAWLAAGALAALLVAMWMQDAAFLVEAGALPTLVRNAIGSAVRVVLPAVTLWLAWPQPVATAWAGGLLVAVAAGWVVHARLAPRGGRDVPVGELWPCGARNVAGSAAEFLPGLVLVPLALASQGAEGAAYFGIAWTIASMLFLGSAAISRSALAQLVQQPHDAGASAATALAVRRAAWQLAILVLPGALLCAALAPVGLSVFGPDYAANATSSLVVLAASALVVAPTYLHLALLRAQDRPAALVTFPLGVLAALAVLAPPLAAAHGILGISLAWLGANVPAAAWATWRLIQAGKEPEPIGRATVGRPADLE